MNCAKKHQSKSRRHFDAFPHLKAMSTSSDASIMHVLSSATTKNWKKKKRLFLRFFCDWQPDHQKKRIISLEPRKKASYFPLYWLVNSDSYTGLLWPLYTWVVYNPYMGSIIPYISQPTRVIFIAHLTDFWSTPAYHSILASFSQVPPAAKGLFAGFVFGCGDSITLGPFRRYQDFLVN